MGGDPARGPGAEDARAFRSPPGWYAACWFRVCTRDFVPAALCLAARVAPGRTHTHTPGAANARVKGEHPLVRALSAIRHRWYVLRDARCSVCTQVCMRERVTQVRMLLVCLCLPAREPPYLMCACLHADTDVRMPCIPACPHVMPCGARRRVRACVRAGLRVERALVHSGLFASKEHARQRTCARMHNGCGYMPKRKQPPALAGASLAWTAAYARMPGACIIHIIYILHMNIHRLMYTYLM